MKYKQVYMIASRYRSVLLLSRLIFEVKCNWWMSRI